MKKNGKKRSLVPLIVILAVALIGIMCLILWKQREYAASEAFYDGLRSLLKGWGAV